MIRTLPATSPQASTHFAERRPPSPSAIMPQQPAVSADGNLVSRSQCYICRDLFPSNWRVRHHFRAVHRDLEEYYQPGRVARVWCIKDTDRVVSLAPLRVQPTPSFLGIAPELRGLIFDYALSLPYIDSQWPEFPISARDPEAFALLYVNRECFHMAKDALRRNNFFVLLKVHASTKDPNEDIVRTLRQDIVNVIPRNVADILHRPVLEVNIFLHAETVDTSSTTTSLFTVHDYNALRAMVSSFCSHQSYIRVLNVDFQLAASQPRHKETKNYIIRAFGYLQGIFNLRIRDFAGGFPADILRVPVRAPAVSGDVGLVLGNEDRLLQDIISARVQGKHCDAIEAATFGIMLLTWVDLHQTGVTTNQMVKKQRLNALVDTRCQLELLSVQSANLVMWEAICSQKPYRIDIQALPPEICFEYTEASNFEGLSASHRAQAYLAKTVAFSFLANMMVRSSMRVKQATPRDVDDGTSNEDDKADDEEHYHEDDHWVFLEPAGVLCDKFLSGPSDFKQVATAPAAFRCAAKYFSLAAELLKEPFRTRAAEMEGQVVAQGEVLRNEVDFKCWRAEAGPYHEAWLGDGLERGQWDFTSLEQRRQRPANWKSRVTPEDEQLDTELCGLNIDLEKLALVCATY